MNGRIDRFLVSHQGRFDIIPKNQILNYQFENATVRSDYSVVKKKGYKDIETVDYKNCKVLFHGSKYGLDTISLGGRRNMDFGSGLYLNDNRSRAESWVHQSDAHKIYMFFVDMTNLNVYKFKNPDMWLYYIACNRGAIDYKYIPQEVKNEFRKINSSDIIVGDIADDRMYKSMTDFLNGDMTFEGLGYCLKYINLGTQYTLKTTKAINSTIMLSVYTLNNNQRSRYARLQEDELKIVAHINKDGKFKFRNGRYVEKVLRGYKI